MKRTAFLLALLGTILWTAFGAVGLYRHAVCQDAPKNALGWTDIGGYDSEGYLPHFTDLHTVFGAKLLKIIGNDKFKSVFLLKKFFFS